MNPGSSIPFLKASWSFWITAGGVPFGAAKPRHIPIAKFTPCSLTVGTVGEHLESLLREEGDDP